jgi:hypothetical protein
VSTKLELNDSFSYDAGTVSSGETIRVRPFEFARSDGTRFNPLALKVQNLTVVATVGGHIHVAIFHP